MLRLQLQLRTVGPRRLLPLHEGNLPKVPCFGRWCPCVRGFRL